jgi:hypothetical protein
MLLTRVIKKELGFGQPTIVVGGDIVYEEGDDIDPSEYAANLPKKLISLPSGGIGHGAVFGVEDFSQDLEVEISVSHRDEWFITVEGEKEVKPDDREEIDKFEIGGKKPVASAAAPSKVAAEGSESTGEQNSSKVEDDDDSIEVVDPTEIDKQAATTNGSSKINSTNDHDDDSDIEVVEVGTPHSAAASNMNASASRMPLKKRRLDWDKTNENDDGAKKPKTGDSSASGHGGVEVIEIDSD